MALKLSHFIRNNKPDHPLIFLLTAKTTFVGSFFLTTTSRSPFLYTGKYCIVKPLLTLDFTERDNVF